MNARLAALALALSALAPRFSQAHHSTAVFVLDKPIEIRGVVRDFKLRSPHSSFVVEGRVFADGRAAGPVERWELEWEALPPLRTLGVDAASFKAGDAITVVASPHRDPAFKFAHAQVVTAADGSVYGFDRSDRIYSPSLVKALADATGKTVSAPPTASTAPAATGIARLAGRWQQPVMPPGKESPLALNEAGLAAWRGYDRKLSPANTCESMAVPDVFMAPFYLFELRVDGESVVLHNEAYDIRRTVPLGGAAARVDERGQHGMAAARVDGDALVVESRGFPASKWGLGAEVQLLGAGADVPSSERKTLTERFTAGSDGRTLVYEFTLDDPAYITKPYSGRVELTRVPDTAQMYPYECDPESAAMWSRDAKDKPLRVGQ